MTAPRAGPAAELPEAADESPETTAQISDAAFEEYLNGGSPLSRAYREIADCAVPVLIEKEVLLQASRWAKVREWLQPATWARWSSSVGIAACVLLTFALLFGFFDTRVPFPPRSVARLVTVEFLDRSRLQPPPSESSPAVIPETPVVAKPVARRAPVQSARPADESRYAAVPAVSEPVPVAPVSVAPLAPEPATLASEVAELAQATPEGTVEVEISDIVITWARVAPDSKKQGVSHPRLAESPSQWLSLIRTLRDRGDDVGAQSELRLFRETNPGYGAAEIAAALAPRH